MCIGVKTITLSLYQNYDQNLFQYTLLDYLNPQQINYNIKAMSIYSNQRRGQKENIYDREPFQIKTRQYSNYSPSSVLQKSTTDSITPKETPRSHLPSKKAFNLSDTYENQQKMGYNVKASEKEKYQNMSPVGVSYLDNYKQKGQFGKLAKTNTPDNYDFNKRNYKDSYEKSPAHRQFIQNSYNQCSKLGDTITQSQNLRKDNARQKGIQIKMNNIQTISDQISSLLNRVINKNSNRSIGKNQETLIQKEQTRQSDKIRFEQYQFREKPQPKKMPVGNNYDQFYQKQKRLRASSGFDIMKQDVSATKKYLPAKYQHNNEQQKIQAFEKLGKYNYPQYSKHEAISHHRKNISTELVRDNTQNTASPSKNQGLQFQYEKQYIYPKTKKQFNNYFVQSKQSKQYKPPQKVYHLNINDIDQAPYFSKPKEISPYNANWQRDQFNREDRELPEYIPKYKKNIQKDRQVENNYMPLTLEKGKVEPVSKSPQTYQIDEQIKRIKNKIKQSQQDNNKMQQRFNMTPKQSKQYKIPEQSAGKLYKKNNVSPVKPFQIIIYPVETDRPTTIKIAEKLSNQIQIDKKLKRPREILAKQKEQSKWSYLQNCLKSKGIKITNFQIKHLIDIPSEQLDALYQNQIPLDYNTSLNDQNIVDLISQAQKHWQKQVYNCVSMRSLKGQNFRVEQIDQRRKGYLQPDDITSFVNLYTGRQYRSKDIGIIYRRLQLLEDGKNQGKVQYGTFMRAITL